MSPDDSYMSLQADERGEVSRPAGGQSFCRRDPRRGLTERRRASGAAGNRWVAWMSPAEAET